MKEEFNLSEQLLKSENLTKVTKGYFFLPANDVKEFIRLLKEEMSGILVPIEEKHPSEMIDKLAGDKLI